jgi:hypothetical protein
LSLEAVISNSNATDLPFDLMAGNFSASGMVFHCPELFIFMLVEINKIIKKHAEISWTCLIFFLLIGWQQRLLLDYAERVSRAILFFWLIG